MNKYTELKVDGYERVLYAENNAVGLKLWIVLHSTKLGPALGGCRMWNYNNEQEALADALRLGKAMSYKNSLANLDFGGGKGAIWGDPKTKTDELLEALGEAVEYLNGTYVTAEDVGLTFDDMKIVRRKTKYVPSIVAGDPAPVTAEGIFNGIQAVCDHLGLNACGITVALQGVGCVGYELAKLLTKAGCEVIACDINNEAIGRAVNDLGITAVPVDDIYDVNCDIFSPCALGGIINKKTICRLYDAQVQAIAGSANNQLANPKLAQELKDMGILYAPDFAINAGGVILLAGETPDGKFNKRVVNKKLKEINPTLTKIFRDSDDEGKTTLDVANELAEERLNA